MMTQLIVSNEFHRFWSERAIHENMGQSHSSVELSKSIQKDFAGALTPLFGDALPKLGPCAVKNRIKPSAIPEKPP
jgi:hypothetical protein